MTIVNVELGSNSYPIYIQADVLSHVSGLLEEHGLTDSLFVITDSNVAPLYGQTLVLQLEEQGFDIHLLTVNAGESSKSLRCAQDLYTQLLRNGADRQSVVLALGGGVVGDLAGFVAATFMRGIRFVQVPTTVLAQVDSSVGGKVGINHTLGKNLIGAFYQPKLVIIDPMTLSTLEQREIRAGFAEVIKYGLIHSRPLFDVCSNHIKELFQLRNPELLHKVIQQSCQVKADVVSEDELEGGLRAILNFGHTLGHALETVTDYDTYLHGEAVIHGMQAALFLSEKISALSPEQRIHSASILDCFKAPPIPESVTVQSLVDAMKTDKKRSSKGQLWVLLEDFGRAVLKRDVSDSDVLEAIDVMLSRGHSS